MPPPMPPGTTSKSSTAMRRGEEGRRGEQISAALLLSLRPHLLLSSRYPCARCPGKTFVDLALHIRRAHSEGKRRPERDAAAATAGSPPKHPCPYCEQQVRHLSAHLRSGHGMGAAEARQMEAGLTGKSAARTDLQWTAFKSGRGRRQEEGEEED